MTEQQFTDALARALVPYLPEWEISTRTALLYALSVDETGKVRIRVDSRREPIRGRGTGFEQEFLVFERVEHGNTSIVPRVAAEVKLRRVTTHDALTYSEKARRARIIYPFIRYGLILGGMNRVPGRVLRLGQEFDFIVTISHPAPVEEIDALGSLLGDEVQASKDLGLMLASDRRVRAVVRALRPTFG